jgi:hypothetical protein
MHVPLIIFVLAPIWIQLAGCAGSASHEVVTAHQASDLALSCEEIESELLKTQIIIDRVNQDKQDLTGADVADAVLWFPFNLIAKDENYRSALEAADRRIERLNQLKGQKNCIAQDPRQTEVSLTLWSEKLRELSRLYKDGVLTEQEYMDAKRKLLAEDIRFVKIDEAALPAPPGTLAKPKTLTLLQQQTNKFTGSRITGPGPNWSSFTMSLNDSGHAEVKVEPHMMGTWTEEGRWWFTDPDRLCVKFRRFYRGEESCRRLIELVDGSVLLSDESTENWHWKLILGDKP